MSVHEETGQRRGSESSMDSRKGLDLRQRRAAPVANPTSVIGRNGNVSRKPGALARWGLNAVLAIVLFTISFAINNAHLEQTALHPDETRWLNRAHYIEDFGNPYGENWQDYYLTRGQPPGGSYLMGIGLWLQGQPLHANGVWDFHYGEDWNAQAGAVPDDEVLAAGRRTNAVVGALVVVLAFLVTSMLSNRVGGVFAALFLAYHPLHITLSTQALSDELLALSLVVTFAAAFRFARSPAWGWALVMGISLGVGGATKLAPLALSFVLAAFGLLWLVVQVRQNGRGAWRWPASRKGVLLLIQPAIAGFVFVAMYPFLWVAPVRRSLDLLEFRRTEMASQARIWPWARVENPKDAFMRYGEQLHDAYSTTRHLQQWADRNLGIPISNPVSIDFIVVAIGTILLVRMVIQRGLWSPHAMVALLMAAEVGAVTVGLGVDFYRYYLPILLVNSILVGIAFGAGAAWLQKVLARRRAPLNQRAPAPSAARWASTPARRESAS